MEPKRKSVGAVVLMCLGILCVLFLLLMIASGVSVVRRDTPAPAEAVQVAAVPDGRAIDAEKDYKMRLAPLMDFMHIKSNPLTRRVYNGMPYYYVGLFSDALGNTYYCAVNLPEGSDLYKRLQAYNNGDGTADVVLESYYSVEEIDVQSAPFKNGYANALAKVQAEDDEQFDGSLPKDCGMLFTYLGDTPEAYVVNKGDAVKRKWSAGILIMSVLLLPLAALFFVLSVVLKRRLKKKLAAAQAAPDAAEPAPIVPDTAEPTPTETAAAEPAPTETDGAGPAQE